MGAQDFQFNDPSCDILRAAAEFAFRNPACHRARTPLSDGAWLALVAGAAARLCFQRLLVKNRIPYRARLGAAWAQTQADQLEFGGRRCRLQNFLLDRAGHSRQRRDALVNLEESLALLPVDALSGDVPTEHDLFLFSAVAAAPAGSLAQTRIRMRNGAPVFLVGRLENRRRTIELVKGSVRLRNEGPGPLVCRLAGADAAGSWREEPIRLNPGGTIRTSGWARLAGLTAESAPGGRLFLAHEESRVGLRLAPSRWLNLWLYDCRVVFLGWLTRSECRSRAVPLPVGTRVCIGQRTDGFRLAVPVRRLRPIAEMMEILHGTR